MNAMVFPGQGAQFPGMGQDLFDGHAFARDRFAEAADVLGFDIADIMFNGSDEDLKCVALTTIRFLSKPELDQDVFRT